VYTVFLVVIFTMADRDDGNRSSRPGQRHQKEKPNREPILARRLTSEAKFEVIDQFTCAAVEKLNKKN